MRFIQAKQQIMSVFETNDLIGRSKRGEKHTQNYVIDILSNRTEIIICFPGYKSAPNKFGGYTYDYRVDIKMPTQNGFQTTLSHANIIADICSKCLDYPTLKPILIESLLEIYKNGLTNLMLSDYQDFSVKPIRPDIIDIVVSAHTALGKQHNLDGNKFSLSFEELFHSILWISLQEDLNYPMPKFEGRRMPFSRYLETIWQIDDNHNLAEVVTRALSHYRPVLWTGHTYPLIIATE